MNSVSGMTLIWSSTLRAGLVFPSDTASPCDCEPAGIRLDLQINLALGSLHADFVSIHSKGRVEDGGTIRSFTEHDMVGHRVPIGGDVDLT